MPWPLLLVAAIAGGQSPVVRLATGGGDAWTFSKTVAGWLSPEACDEVLLHSPAATVSATLAGDRFFGTVPLREALNEVTAECRHLGISTARTAPQRWRVRLADGPKAWIRTRRTAAGIVLDAGRTERAPAMPAAIVRYVWTERDGNPAPLFTSPAGRPLRNSAEGETIEIVAPESDGEYVVELRVSDSLGRADSSATMFAVENGLARTIDLSREHPRWVNSAVLYGIAPHFFGEDELEGVTARLDEIAALGATAIWLSPLTEAPDDDFGYAVLDHFDLRERFGDEAQLRALIRRAHSLGLKVLMDFVPNHVSERHAYHRSAVQNGPRSPYFTWFERDAGGDVTSYFDWSNLKNLDYDNPEVQAYIIAAFAHWVREYGIDGFRVDASWAIRERAPEFWPRWREELKRIEPDLFLLAEASARDQFYVRHGFDAAYDWTWSLGEWAWNDAFDERRPDLDALRAALTNAGAGFTGNDLALRFINNNDTGERFITRHGSGLTRAAVALLFTVPGVPLIYNGDEVGAEFEPYDEGPPIDWRDPHGLVPYYARLTRLRRSVSALTSRRLELIATDRGDSVLAFLRPHDDPAESVLVVLNFAARAARIRLRSTESLTALFGANGVEDLLTGSELPIDPLMPVLELAPYQVLVLRCRPADSKPAACRASSRTHDDLGASR